MIYKGIYSLFKFKGIKIQHSQETEQNRFKNDLWMGLYLSLANPVALIFWSSIFAASLNSHNSFSIIGFLENLFVIVGVLMWGVALSGVLDLGNTYLNEKNVIRINRISGFFMLYYGIKYFWIIIQKISS